MDLEDGVLREISGSQEGRYSIIPLGLDARTLKLTETDSRMTAAKGEGGGNGYMLGWGYLGSVGRTLA